ncbi:myosin-1-like [Canna indica]|uniref:Myosin-1-like n=1 Tax=Canna indica TaxID=4628 RepID=A0AAQ3QBN1_9LILI|nr:myosin-1-like [Canna indica]
MFSATTMSPSVARSSLELMLDRLRDDQPKDLPPALPIRPTSRGRLPTPRRSAVVNLKLERSAPEEVLKDSIKCNNNKEEMLRGDNELVFRSGIFGSRKVAKVEPHEESPYAKMTKPECSQQKVELADDAETAVITLPSSILPDDKLGRGDTIEYAIKKNLQVWCWIQNARWEKGQVQMVSGDNVVVLLSDCNIPLLLDRIFNSFNVKNGRHGSKSRTVPGGKSGIYRFLEKSVYEIPDELNLKAADEYEYLKQSNCLTIDNVDDAQRFHILMEALDVFQISKENQKNVFSILAAILWLGNIGFSVIDNENHVEVILGEGVTNSAKLMGCEVPDLMLALSTRKIQAGNDSIVQKLTLQQAIDARDALAKSMYSSLFDWLVEQINKSLEVGKCCTGKSISILDIFGFESFHKNGFEQFCINYANERLQQHFNRHLFKLEQEEYAQEGIDWAKVEFLDNTDCLNLFEKRPLGLISLLDEESTFPKATDLTFVHKLQQHLTGNHCFKGERGGVFRVSHYAGEVLYDSSGFLEKNRDTLHADLTQLFFSCANHLLKSFASNILQSEKEPSQFRQPSSDLRKQSVVAKFKGQLFKLMQRLESTSPHFIRCIKPNNKQLPGMYEHDLVLQQLRWCGVLEVVRISRYGFLLENSSSHDALSLSVAILQHFNVHPEMYRVGYTKLFFRTGQIAVLEDARNQILQGIVCVQKNFRGFQARRFYQQMRNGAITIQSFIQGEKARHEFEVLSKRWKAAILIQKHVRHCIAKTRLSYQQKDVVLLQSVIRGWLARKKFMKLKWQEMPKPNHAKECKSSERNLPEHMKDTTNILPQIDLTIMDELHRRALKAEAALREKEEENALLQQRLKQYEARWSVYELKMKSMEQTWHKQLTSLQSTLVAARRSLIPDGMASQNGQLDISSINHNYDSEDTVSADTQTPDDTPKQSTDGTVRNCDSKSITVIHLVKEFEKQQQVFEDDAGFILEVKSGQSSSKINPDVELQNLKERFSTWKKVYKLRLRETKGALQKYGNTEEKLSKKWWSKRSTR